MTLSGCPPRPAPTITTVLAVLGNVNTCDNIIFLDAVSNVRYLRFMANATQAESKVPFNLRGEDAEQFERVRRGLERTNNIRLSAVQTLRMLVGKEEKRLAASLRKAS